MRNLGVLFFSCLCNSRTVQLKQPCVVRVTPILLGLPPQRLFGCTAVAVHGLGPSLMSIAVTELIIGGFSRTCKEDPLSL
jgi:hypothetical protein